MYIVLMNINGVTYYGEGDSMESAQELAQPWLLKANHSYPHQEWKASVYHVVDKTEVTLVKTIKPELGHPLAA